MSWPLASFLLVAGGLGVGWLSYERRRPSARMVAVVATLAADLRARAESGQAVIVATHDPEFAAACATRCVLLADGRVIADSTTRELLAGGWYFATETARILGAGAGVLLPEQGAALLAARARGNAASGSVRESLVQGVS